MQNNQYPHEIKAIVSDIDHTFISSYSEYDSSVIVSDTNKEMVKWVQDQGILFTYATGRHLNQFDTFTQLPDPSTYVLCNNGGVIYDSMNKKVIRDSCLDYDLSVKVMEFLQQNNKQVYMTTGDGFYLHNFHGLDKEYSDIAEMGTYVDDPFEFIKNVRLQRFEFFGENSELRTFQNSLIAADIIDDTAYSVFTSQRSLGIYSTQAQKGAGVEFLSQHHNIPLENFMVFGDAMNDYSMFQKAGVKVAMVEAMADLKNFPGAYISTNCEHNAVGEFLRMWFHRN